MNTINKYSPLELVNNIFLLKKSFIYLFVTLLVINVFQFISIFVLFSKPPLVIKVDELGQNQVIHNYNSQDYLYSDKNIHSFVSIFLNNYLGLNSNDVISQLEASFNMMTEEFGKNHLETLRQDQTITQIQAAQISNIVSVKKITTKRNRDGFLVNLKVAIITKQLSTGEQISTKTADSTLILKKTDITPQTPYGMLVDHINVNVKKDPKMNVYEDY